MMQVARIKKEKCDTSMCNRCVRFCPRSTKAQPVIFIGRNKKATVNEELCNGCGKCVRICREKAIEMVFVQEKTVPGLGKSEGAEEAAAVAASAPAAEDGAAASKQTAPSRAENTTPAPEPAKPAAPPKRKLTPEEKLAGKRSRHIERVIRTAIACLLGIIAGIASFYLAGNPDPLNNFVQPMAVIGLLVVVIAIVIQKSLFMLIKRIDLDAMGKKDWFYQGFMTVCCWFLSWTMMLTMSVSAVTSLAA
ncbi:MAG TPA: 4Fe-4S binding protein [Methanocorpusculum sp.]|nr:4Fe-4S binding protein [Methanocorpusculum sp.]